MVAARVERLKQLCIVIPPLLSRIGEEDFVLKPGPQKWSKKEILGHLIDSAANNHQRFIRVQFEDMPFIRYDQNQWNQLTHYQEKNTEELIRFWTLYNQHLAHLISFIPEENLQKLSRAARPEPVTLEWLIDDYVAHLEHHLRQIVAYP
jgi:hypothetical protein